MRSHLRKRNDPSSTPTIFFRQLHRDRHRQMSLRVSLIYEQLLQYSV